MSNAMQVTKLVNGARKVVFVVNGERAAMFNNLDEHMAMAAEDAEERIGRLLTAGWTRTK